MTGRIYLDHAATTPLRPEAREAMERGFDIWANPSSPHAEGRKARAALEDARERVKAALGWDGEVIFTSGASEAAALARSSRALTFGSVVEHDAIYDRIDYPLPVETDGKLNLHTFGSAVRTTDVLEEDVSKRALVAVQLVNSETGNRQDIGVVAQAVEDVGGVLLVDCAQSAGKFEIPRIADMAIVSAHKFGGPIGVGALLVKSFSLVRPTGGQERGYRRGTENLPGVLGMAAALEACADPYVCAEALTPIDSFADSVRSAGGDWISDRLSDPTPYIRAIAMPHMNASAQVMRFDMEGISVSQGSACSSGTMKPSRVLKAMGLDADLASRTIRVSVGWNTTRAEVERFCEAWLAMAREANERAA